MKCYLCKKNAEIEQQKGRAICNNCFARLTEKRVRKFSRINKIFQPNDRILVIGEVNKSIAEDIVGKLPLKLFFRTRDSKEFVKKNKINKILLPWTLDDEANDFLMKVLKGKKPKKFDKKHIKFLVTLTNNDVEIFASTKELKFKPNKIDPYIKKLIDELHEKHPSAKYTLLKNIQDLEELLLNKK